MGAVGLKRRADAITQKGIAPGKKINYLGNVLEVKEIVTSSWLIRTMDGSLLEPRDVSIVEPKDEAANVLHSASMGAG